MGIYLRQVCLVARQLASVADLLVDVFSLKPAYQDEEVGRFGLENVVFAVGTNFLEVVAPIRPETAAERFLERRSGDGGYMIIGQVLSPSEQAACRERAAKRGVRVAWEAQRPGWKIMQLHPRDMQAAFFEIDWEAASDPRGHWSPAGGDAWQGSASNAAALSIDGLELRAPDADALADLWADVAGTPVVEKAGWPTVVLENADLRFVRANEGELPRISGVDLQVSDKAGILERANLRGSPVSRASLEIGGVTFRLLP